MLTYLAAAAFPGGVWASDADTVVLPSGLETYLQETLWDRPGGGLVYRFRFVAPAFSAAEADFDAVSADLEHLCNSFALPRLSNVGPLPSQIIISLADRESEFGVIDPDVSQVFEAYSIEEDTCKWEVF
ncbi:DUF6497 family protein [Roseovarius sp. CAU 1744]|uniref:DUF6497 family protein n=1 Tax=Roseovarius sp. CAU 1744 TaxID=3140368 RepID=UPI00325BEBF3